MGFKKKNKNEKVEITYKSLEITPDLKQRQYEEENYKKYNIRKKHSCITKKI